MGGSALSNAGCCSRASLHHSGSCTHSIQQDVLAAQLHTCMPIIGFPGLPWQSPANDWASGTSCALPAPHNLLAITAITTCCAILRLSSQPGILNQPSQPLRQPGAKMASQTLAGLRAQLPCRVSSSRVQRSAAIRCGSATLALLWGRPRCKGFRSVPCGREAPGLHCYPGRVLCVGVSKAHCPCLSAALQRCRHRCSAGVCWGGHCKQAMLQSSLFGSHMVGFHGFQPHSAGLCAAAGCSCCAGTVLQPCSASCTGDCPSVLRAVCFSGKSASPPPKPYQPAHRTCSRCMAAPQRRQQQAAAPEPSAATALALSSLLLGGAPAWADEAAAPAAAATGDAAEVVTGIAPAGWALILSPIAFYALFNVYRSQVGGRLRGDGTCWGGAWLAAVYVHAARGPC